MNPLAAMALTVKELEPGEFHWIWLDETASSDDDLLSYSPRIVSPPHANAAAAWTAGYLALRAALRSAPT
ncbi:hypothetical protein [Variovorax sp. PvP013]|jgi:hypothetical protein|uniref:hypothetical protein n=1 Tax=Variovorax sp. PvP013 TaxID=3156435 RepID=UPI003D222E70